jgi:hypothetical protein
MDRLAGRAPAAAVFFSLLLFGPTGSFASAGWLAMPERIPRTASTTTHRIAVFIILLPPSAGFSVR